jgi:hypothetical protein
MKLHCGMHAGVCVSVSAVRSDFFSQKKEKYIKAYSISKGRDKRLRANKGVQNREKEKTSRNRI